MSDKNCGFCAEKAIIFYIVYEFVNTNLRLFADKFLFKIVKRK